ncbi:hypothetical protein NQ314_000549 [Rhamnusium bicolor]|uniref:DNA/RNA non-specific endonuclease/pyrophosphatase/phosphodiesterase domain-containing protein n=1 Tax=Rhamnusium bicolor TaxID=1586634 RepID=A0AAV8ZUW1_9CUCU|nr:hypothetical protein NQ314_000549 [Rhamnusium bicolor]
MQKMRGLPVLTLLSFVTFVNCFTIPGDVKATGCQINIKVLPANTPLLLTSKTREVIFPNLGTSFVNLAQNEKIDLDCPGTGNIQAGGATIVGIAEATCVSGWDFQISGRQVNISSVLCSSRITSTARATGKTCWGKGIEIEIGLQLHDGRFIQQYTSCFDDVARNVLYSRYFLTNNIENQLTGGTSPSWSEDTFYNLGARVNNIYPIATHRVTINKQLGLPDGDLKYVGTGHYYLAKGHLTARTDYMYNAQQMSTFHYVNSAPQWQTFNGYNWFYFERSLRVYASKNLVDLEVYTGTYGISTLPHATTGRDVELYFYVDNNGNKAMPIPELFWKVAYDPINRAGIAVLGINNPYQTDVTKSIICNDVADRLNWLTFDRFRLEYGYIYACTIADFRKVVPNLPNFDARNILN